jgi:hypothetical protein
MKQAEQPPRLLEGNLPSQAPSLVQATAVPSATPAQLDAVPMELVVFDNRNASHVYPVSEGPEKKLVDVRLIEAQTTAANHSNTDIREIAMSMADASMAFEKKK